MVSSDWIYRYLEKTSAPNKPWVAPEGGQYFKAMLSSLDNIPERHVGAFAGWAGGNDLVGGYVGFPWLAFLTPDDFAFMHCCTCNCTRAIYYAWEEHILSFKDDTLRVNLLLNRASPWADVDSYIPYEGRVDVKIKQACNLKVRIPEWVKPQETFCRVNKKMRKLTFEGRYAQVGNVKKGDLVAVTFPISERTVKTTIGGDAFTLIIKGNDVVFIDPPGKWYPFYQRAHYRQNKVRWVERERFVADKVIRW